MAEMDKDLLSIQQARSMVTAARDAQRIWAKATQEEVDRVCAAMAEAAYGAAERLGRMASEETGFGVPEHKKLKNEFASMHVWESIKDVKTVGVVNHDAAAGIYEIAWPMGVVAALTPSTNPTSTVINKTLISLKARNSIVIAPHPSAVNCCVETARVLAKAAEAAGAPAGLIHCMSHISLEGTQALMAHKYIGVILATGGSPMVRAAHSAGKPAYGVGPGNVPAYVDRSADLERAARYIVASKAFDYSVICATEQAVVADRPIAARLKELMQAEGAYFVDEAQAEALRRTLFYPNGGINAQTVGKSPQYLAAMAGMRVPESARILVVPLSQVGPEEPLSREKLTTVLGFYEADGWEAGCDISLEMIHFGGRGHSLMIHATDEKVIMAFGLEKPVFRIGVNTMGTLGTIGLTTKVRPSLTLGSGGFGGAITGDNITVEHLFNIKRMAYETVAPPEAAMRPGMVPAGPVHGPSPQELDEIVRQVVQEILGA
ncbi:MAG: aldehyde dehydrogenase family protein [Anaerolineae bacterium]|nr:aldehyde dehydrogenase family protein [Anaerolineae bacterium]